MTEVWYSMQYDQLFIAPLYPPVRITLKDLYFFKLKYHGRSIYLGEL